MKDANKGCKFVEADLIDWQIPSEGADIVEEDTSEEIWQYDDD